MTGASVIDDVVVLLPGITGSVLKKNGNDVWAPSLGGLRGLLTHGLDNIRGLALQGDDPNLDDLGDGVTADSLMPDVHLIPGLWKIDGYTKVRNALCSNLQLTPGSNYFEFPYDWRRTNVVAARKLARQAEQWLDTWRKASGKPNARLILLAHSMGGIVARHFLEVLDGWRITRALVSFGTPYRGSVKGLAFVANGFVQQIGPLKADLSDAMRSFTAIYELLPIYECCDLGHGHLERIGEVTGIPNVDPVRARAALKFHRDIEAKVTEHQQVPEYVSQGYKILPVVSSSQPTLQSAKVVGGGVQATMDRNGNDEGGDGTVPYVSAIPIEFASDRGTFVDEVHGSLQNSDPVITHVEGALRALTIDLSVVRATTGIAVGLGIQDAYAATDPVHIRALPDQQVAFLQATVTDASTNQADAPLTMRRNGDGDGWWTGDLGPLRAGVYRVTVGGPANVSPVTDVFAVFD
jgi:hypothetical protein